MKTCALAFTLGTFTSLLGVAGQALAVTLTHSQLTLNRELVGVIGNSGPYAKENVEIEITNNTTSIWTDYHFEFVNPNGSVFNIPNTVLIDNVVLGTNPFDNSKINVNNQLVGAGPEKQALLTLFEGNVAPGRNFKVSLVLDHSNSVDVYGTPSVPEPLTILGTGVVLGALPVLKKEYAKRNKKKDKDT